MSVMTPSVMKKTLVLVFLSGGLWLAGLISYSAKVPNAVSDSTTPTDAIVALTGGSGRIDMGINLLAAGMAERLFISGTGRNVSADDLIDLDRPNREALLERMSVGAEAEDTFGNATETANWVSKNSVKSIRLVTAAYHMPRSLRELRQAMPDIQIVPHPVFPDQVKKDWWRNPGSAGLLATEYTKYLFASVRLWAVQSLGTGTSLSSGAKPS